MFTGIVETVGSIEAVEAGAQKSRLVLFESFVYPLIIMLSVPLATAGGVGGLALLNLFTFQSLDMLTMDGVSLTVVGVEPEGFDVVLIPHTLAETTLGDRAPGDPVNLEADILGKYVQRYLERMAER